MTHPANKRRTGNEMTRAYKALGIQDPGGAEKARRSPRGKRLEELRKRKQEGSK